MNCSPPGRALGVPCQASQVLVVSGSQQTLEPRGNSEQHDIQLLLQCLDLMTDGSLGNVQLNGRPGKAQMACRSLKRPQCIQEVEMVEPS